MCFYFGGLKVIFYGFPVQLVHRCLPVFSYGEWEHATVEFACLFLPSLLITIQDLALKETQEDLAVHSIIWKDRQLKHKGKYYNGILQHNNFAWGENTGVKSSQRPGPQDY